MRSYTLPAFGGLDLRADAEDTNGAVDCLNIDFDRDGRVRTRDGYSELVAAGGNVWMTMRAYGTAGDFVAAGLGGGAFEVFTNAGATTATATLNVNATALSLASLATPTANYIYAGDGDAAGHITRWDGASITYPNVGYNAYYASTTPWDNRLVLANITNPASNPSGVRFSDPGAPETFGVNNNLNLHPGDREQIGAVCVWRNQLFVFKNTKFFVVYGTRTDSTGNPIFDYRTVDTGVGVGIPGVLYTGGAVAMDDGVYFCNQHGLYRTTGGPPVKVSRPVDPVFNVGSSSYFTGATYGQSHMSLGRWRDYVMLGYANGGVAATLVYDTITQRWSYWDLESLAFLEYQTGPTATQELLVATSSGLAISQYGSAYTTDNGSAISWKYRTGFGDYGTPDAEKHFREVILDGTGTVNVKRAVNDAVTLSTAQSVTLGTSPAVAQGRDRRGLRGRNLSVEISGTGPSAISRLGVNVLSERTSGEKATS